MTGNRRRATFVESDVRTLSIVVLAAVLGLAACGDGDSAVDAGDPLTGRTFLSEAVTGHELVPGTQVQLVFHDDGRLTASAGCNTMGGPVRITTERIEVEGLSTTEMGCDQPRHDQDLWLAELLTAGPAYELEDEHLLRLTAGDAAITLVDREVADPDRPLEGTAWVLDGLVEGDSVSSMPVGVEGTLRIEDGRVNVQVCNQGSAEVTVTGDEIVVGELVMTDMACEDDRMAVEAHVVATLDGTITYAIEASRLTLTHPDGHGVVLRAAD